MSIQIVLTPTTSHCIETVARREYWKHVDIFLKKRKEDKRLEETIELLKTFLETADFGKLRGQSEKHIINGKQVTYIVSMKNTNLCYEMKVADTKQ